MTTGAQLPPEEKAFRDHMNRGLAAEERGAFGHAIESYGRALRLRPDPLAHLYLAHALLLAGRGGDAAAVASLGQDLSPAVLHAWRGSDPRPPIAERSRRVDRGFRAHLTALHRASVERSEAELGEALPRVRRAIWCQTHPEPFEYAHPLQRPWLLWLPDLPARPWFEVDELPGARALEDQWQVLRDEALTALETRRDQRRPYVRAEDPAETDFAPLHGSSRWDSLHLYRVGEPAPSSVRTATPIIDQAARALQLTRLNGVPMEVFLSVLAADTAIPPHHGLANTRLTVHLPLQLAGDCGLQVGRETRQAVPGRLLAFDDSFLHEAWNRSREPRVHLIWRPGDPICPQRNGRHWSGPCADRDHWNRNRRLPDPESPA
ncbi:MAG: aspartyl/asparaginyl beta-hydroxylase domain-containing protein [Gammaproteobacteria bacterium]|nr:aspartyl/asparaginyl beta-hydroxylase domain-containing protein [Gammaproteobacteria bacterium]